MIVSSLFIVATPIGNLSDITLRALETLKLVDLIAAEDTRHSKKLLHYYQIDTHIVSLHNYNETNRTQFILQKLRQGKRIALITDAGTPLISDPGYHLVKTVREYGFQVISIPGACAAIAALTVAGLPTDRFIFEGFLPAKSKQQLQRLQELVVETRSMIFYESPHRLLTTIRNMVTVFGVDRYMVIAKELTKTFETIYGGTVVEVQNWLMAKPEHQKGEFVILVKGGVIDTTINPKVLAVLQLLSKHVSHKQAVLLTSQITGVSKNQLYKSSLGSNH